MMVFDFARENLKYLVENNDKSFNKYTLLSLCNLGLYVPHSNAMSHTEIGYKNALVVAYTKQVSN